MIPGGLEMMDNLAIRAAEDFIHAGYPVDAEAILLCEVDGAESDVQEDCERVEALLSAAGATEIRLGEERSRTPALLGGPQECVSRRSAASRRTTTAWTARFRAANWRACCTGIADLSAQYGLQVANVFHAGDGNMHPLILFDANAPGEMDRAETIGARILELCVEVGGSITGEHGVGREKINQMCAQFNSDELTLFHARQGRVRSRRPAQSRQERADAASLRRVRLDARPSRRAALSRTGALLMRRDLDFDRRQRASRRAGAATRLPDDTPLRIRGGDSKAFLGRPVAGAAIDTRSHRGIVEL